MSFQLYRFSQSPTVTFFSVVYAVVTMLFYGLKLNLILSAVISMISFLIIFIPIISILYPVIFLGYMVASAVVLFEAGIIHFYIVLAVFSLTVFRFGFMFLFALKNPSLSRDYDMILRNGK